MAYSQQTTHYGLPLPTSGDKSTFLDTNDAFGRIDSDIYEAKTNATAAVQDIGQIQLDVSQLKASTLEIQTNISQIASRQTISETNITALQNAMTTAQADVAKLQNDYGTTDISDIGDGTVTGAISSLAGKDFVEITPNSGETVSEVLTRLYNALDRSKLVLGKSRLEIHNDADTISVATLNAVSNNNYLNFSGIGTYTSSGVIDSYGLSPTGGTNVYWLFGNGTFTMTNTSSQVAGAAKYKVIY